MSDTQPCTPTSTAKSNTFLMAIDKLPISNTMITSVTLPTVMMGDFKVPNKNLHFNMAGNQLTFNELIIDCKLDENYDVYMEQWDWLQEMSNPNTEIVANSVCDAHLTILNSNSTPILNIKFHDVFITEIDDIPLNTAAADEISISATLQYTQFTIERVA